MAYQNIKYRCSKNGHYLIAQAQKLSKSECVIKGHYLLCDAEQIKGISTQIYAKNITNGTRNVRCSKCGSTKLFGCECSVDRDCASRKTCKGAECLFCKYLQPDLTRATVASNQYNSCAGISDIGGARDVYGNAQGSSADLARDNAFDGQTIAVLQLYYSNDFDFSLPAAALKQKGFAVRRELTPPSNVQEFEAFLKDTCQLWIIAASEAKLADWQYKLIQKYFESGRGLYIWADNEPFVVDANAMARRIFGSSFRGDYIADRVLSFSSGVGSPGIKKDHLITTGIVNFYEGITVSSPSLSGGLEALMYASDGKVLAAYYDKNGQRAILDGGFTRLYFKWDTAGTDRYVKNAAAWLANVERFWYEYQE